MMERFSSLVKLNGKKLLPDNGVMLRIMVCWCEGGGLRKGGGGGKGKDGDAGASAGVRHMLSHTPPTSH
jgi:hypothetical protein